MSMGSNVLVLGCVAVMCSCVSSPSTTHQRWSQRDSSIEVRLAAAKTLIKPGDSFGQVVALLGPPSSTVREWGVATPSLDDHPAGNRRFCRWRLTYRFFDGGIDVVVGVSGVALPIEDAVVEQVVMAADMVLMLNVPLMPIER